MVWRSSLRRNASGIPCALPDGDADGGLMSPWASTQMTARSSSTLAWPWIEPIATLWSPPRSRQHRSSPTDWLTANDIWAKTVAYMTTGLLKQRYDAKSIQYTLKRKRAASGTKQKTRENSMGSRPVCFRLFGHICSGRDPDLWPYVAQNFRPPITHSNQFENVFFENVFCDLEFSTHDLRNLTVRGATLETICIR